MKITVVPTLPKRVRLNFNGHRLSGLSRLINNAGATRHLIDVLVSGMDMAGRNLRYRESRTVEAGSAGVLCMLLLL